MIEYEYVSSLCEKHRVDGDRAVTSLRNELTSLRNPRKERKGKEGRLADKQTKMASHDEAGKRLQHNK